MIRALAATLALIACAPPLAAEVRYICWRGAGGYTMTGRMEFPDAVAARGVITEADLTGFHIKGFHFGAPIGSWSLAALTDQTSWLLRYDPERHLFDLGGLLGLYQAWNANGAVSDCGVPGFGFNAGNGGQDICVDGRFVTESTIPWDTPLVTYDAPQPPDCIGPELLGKASLP